MSGIAEQLDAKLKTLDARAASCLEKLVRDAMELVETQNGGSQSDRLPPDFFARIAREFGGEPFARPAQGEFEPRKAIKIAAIARAHGLTLVSADQEFGRVSGLSIADWMQS
jgi:hypothetical protein